MAIPSEADGAIANALAVAVVADVGAHPHAHAPAAPASSETSVGADAGEDVGALLSVDLELNADDFAAASAEFGAAAIVSCFELDSLRVPSGKQASSLRAAVSAPF
mmetsp:Transcript_52430/g.114346  ORF Transcript_52430/g.114346 Transcript_52430/m.114346 type:complete len:106 (+) Transcript_52430:1017-1334(+)|eukprot:1577987-Pleurochrysis_carterae.AAC.2